LADYAEPVIGRRFAPTRWPIRPTALLGKAGASNGCISVKDYEKLLKAYEDGKFNQIIVLRSADEPVPSLIASAQAQGT
jgi:hypothetical protein